MSTDPNRTIRFIGVLVALICLAAFIYVVTLGMR